MLLTKLHIPQTSRNIIHRTSLFEKLNEGINRKLILVSAPAGYGKTTILTDWIHYNKIATAWYSIDSGDNDLNEFISYVIRSIQKIHKNIGKNSLEILESPGKVSIDYVTELFINDLIHVKDDLLLVLDDFQFIENNQIVNMLSFLLEHKPRQFHIAISTRSDPAITMARLRSQNELLEIRSADLCFSEKDISVLFNSKLKLELGQDDINILESKTEGWIAGLQLAALSMQGYQENSLFIKAFAGNNRYIMDYLIEEVLSFQSDEIKEFLLNTSTLGQISAPLCDSVLNLKNSHELINKLEKSNMFLIALDEERYWYRYHHLFSDLLKQRLIQKDKTIIIALHNRACDWFNENNMFSLAIEHALEARNFDKCIALLKDNVENLWAHGRHEAILKYGDLIPDELIDKNPDFCLYYSWILITDGNIQKAEPFLISAEKIAKNIITDSNSSKKEIEYSKKLLGKIAVAFAYLNSFKKETGQILEYCNKALEFLPKEDSLWHSWVWFSYGIAYFSIGEISKSNEAYEKALAYGKKSGSIYLISTVAIRLAENEVLFGNFKKSYNICTDILKVLQKDENNHSVKADWNYAGIYSILAWIHFQWSEMDKAYEYILCAYNLTRKSTDIVRKSTILLNYSIIIHFMGKTVAAEEKLIELKEILQQNIFPPFVESMYVGWNIYRLINLKRHDDAQKFLQEQNIEQNTEITHLNANKYMALTQLLLSQNKATEAEPVLSKLIKYANAQNMNEVLIELYVLNAVLNNIRDKRDKALSNLIKAMELASDENLLSFFVSNPYDISSLLNDVLKILATTHTKIPTVFINNLKVAIKKRDKLLNESSDMGLSQREMDTLNLIAQNLTNQEIANELYISITTVKTHVRNILSKLDAKKRNEAVIKAKEKGMLRS